MRAADPDTSAPASSRLPSLAVAIAHAAAAAVFAAGLAAVLWRPLAPAIGMADPMRWFDAEYLELARAYRTPRYAAALLALLLGLAVPFAVALAPAGRRLTDRIAERMGPRRPARAAALVIATVVVAVDVALLPLSFWASYVHEGAYGFRTHGLAGWSYDWLIARAPSWLAAAALALGGYALMRRLPRAWPAVAGLAAAALTALIVFLAPLLLEPLWLRTEPLPEGPDRQAIRQLLQRADVGIDTILVADASRRTTKHNAYISGLGQTRRVVVWDTLLADQPPEKVAMVVAHELGHHLHADVLRGTLFGGAGAMAVSYALAVLLGWRVRRGRQAGPGDPRAAALVLAVVLALNAASLPVQSWASRRAERAADFASLNLTADPITYLDMHSALARANLSDPRPPRWVYVLWSTHPASSQRLTMGERWSDPTEGASAES